MVREAEGHARGGPSPIPRAWGGWSQGAWTASPDVAAQSEIHSMAPLESEDWGSSTTSSQQTAAEDVSLCLPELSSTSLLATQPRKERLAAASVAEEELRRAASLELSEPSAALMEDWAEGEDMGLEAASRRPVPRPGNILEELDYSSPGISVLPPTTPPPASTPFPPLHAPCPQTLGTSPGRWESEEGK